MNTSPHKRRKLEGDADSPLHEEGDTHEDQVGHEDAMPGFYVHDEEDNTRGDEEMEEDDQEEVEIAASENQVPSIRPRPPVSAPARSSGSTMPLKPSGSAMPDSAKPLSAGHVQPTSKALREPILASDPALAVVPSGGFLQCPVCEKMLETDNQGLNSHIDFCLSRGAIMEAQTKAKSPVKGFQTWAKTPTSSTARKKR